MTKALEKQQRVEHCNELIRLIGSCGRRFFYNAEHDRYAYMEIVRGRIYIVDDYSGKRIYTRYTPFGNRWKGFSHGGTLRDLVERMRDYIAEGKKIPIGYLPLERWEGGLKNNIWGYAEKAAEHVRTEALKSPVVWGVHT